MNVLVYALALSLLCFAPAWADTPAASLPISAAKPAASFYPAVINFGLVPSNTKCTQLVTVTLDRRVFSDHLPTLVPDRNSQADVSLFARFDGPDFIQVVYQVTVNAYFCIGPFQDHLSLVDSTKVSALYPLGTPVKDTGINVVGESVQGLEPSTQSVNFGSVKVGASKLKSVTIGFYAPPMVRLAPPGTSSHILLSPAPGQLSGWQKVSVTSTSPYFTAQELTGLSGGLNASSWQVWRINFKSHLPLGRMSAEMQFKTPGGYCAPIFMTAEIIPADKPEPHKAKTH